jgi:hypothetical protein
VENRKTVDEFKPWKIQQWGSRGRTPWDASPSGGERGSPSHSPKNRYEENEKAIFSSEPLFSIAVRYTELI